MLRAVRRLLVLCAACAPAGIAAVLAACYAPGPQFSPSLAGCYAVRAPGWTGHHGSVSGLQSLPAVILLDTVDFGRVLVPAEWKEAHLTRSIQVHAGHQSWHRGRDTIAVDPWHPRRPFPGDSLVLRFMTALGRLDAHLARDRGGLHGFADASPRELDPRATPIAISLLPAACGSRMVPGADAPLQWF